MWTWLLQTDGSVAPLILRLTLGIVFFTHGAQKTVGWFGGHGFKGTMQFLTQKMGIPAAFAFLAIMAESLGSLGLILGLGTRVAAFGILAVMVVAVLTNLRYGFFMNWYGTQNGEGIEYHLLAIGITLALVVTGAGPYSVDGIIAGR
jgi:putative oxidoreductase